jgi:hypothetical protein
MSTSMSGFSDWARAQHIIANEAHAQRARRFLQPAQAPYRVHKNQHHGDVPMRRHGGSPRTPDAADIVPLIPTRHTLAERLQQRREELSHAG